MDVTPTMLRTLAGLLELGGLCLVARGIYNLHRQFGGAPLPPAALARFVQRSWNQLRGRGGVTRVTLGTAHEVDHAFPITVKTSPSEDLPLEEKVAWLIREVDRLDDEDSKLSDRVDVEEEERNKALQDEQTRRGHAINELTEDIRTLATGDLTRQFWGVIAFGFGIILQVWSQEIARLV